MYKKLYLQKGEYMIRKRLIFVLVGIVLFAGCKDKANIFITTEPPGASVMDASNDKILGTTPYEEYKKDVGTYQYLLRLKYYKDVKVSIEIKDATDIQKKEITLSDLRNVSIVTEPTGASITGLGVDGETTPYSEVLKPGKYELTLTKEGFPPEKVSFKINKEGDKFEKRIRFWDNRNVAIDSEPAGATITGLGTDGKTTPFLEEVKPGKYMGITVSKEGFHEEKLGFILRTTKDRYEKRFKLLTTKEYEIKKLECEKQSMLVVEGECNWGPYMGVMEWGQANAKCRSMGMRLPTFDELRTVYLSGLTESWQKDGYEYWSSSPPP
jgi:hypothetical protein